MQIVGISMIRNDADIVEPFVRHALRRRPGHVDNVRFDHGHDETAADIPPGKLGTDGRQRA